MKPDQAQAFIALLDGSIQGAAQSQAAGDAAMTRRYVQTINMASSNASQLWPDADIDGTGNTQVMAFEDMQNPTRPCRDAAIDAGTWWLNVVGHDPDLADKAMQSYQANRAACLKGAPHFAAWLKPAAPDESKLQ